MLRFLGQAAVVLGVLALLGGAIALFNAKDVIVGRDYSSRDVWNPIAVTVGLNMLVGGVLTALLGFIGIGVADIRDAAERDVGRRHEAEATAGRQATVERYAAALAPVYQRLLTEEGPEIAEKAVRLLAEAKAAGRHLNEATALTQAKAEVEMNSGPPSGRPRGYSQTHQ